MEDRIKQKIKELEFKDVEVKVSDEKRWYHQVTVKFGYAKIRISELRSGCGAMLFSGYSNLSFEYINNPSTVGLFKFIFSLYKNNCETFITTVGTNYATSINFLKSLGFVEVDRYPNKRHKFTKDTQLLMVYTASKNKNNKKEEINVVV